MNVGDYRNASPTLDSQASHGASKSAIGINPACWLCQAYHGTGVVLALGVVVVCVPVGVVVVVVGVAVVVVVVVGVVVVVVGVVVVVVTVDVAVALFLTFVEAPKNVVGWPLPVMERPASRSGTV
jgi:hypothetical protein